MAEVKIIIENILEESKPFTDKLVEVGMSEQSEKIIGLIKAIEEDTLNCMSLYLMLQMTIFDEIEEAHDEASKSFLYLYDLMTKLSDGAVSAMTTISEHTTS